MASIRPALAAPTTRHNPIPERITARHITLILLIGWLVSLTSMMVVSVLVLI